MTLIGFFLHLRRHRLPVSIQEFLTLLEALSRQVAPPSLDAFYRLARITLVKDESLYDRYDQAFASYYRQAAAAFPQDTGIDPDWLAKRLVRELSDADRQAIEKLGWDELMRRFAQRLQEQRERHEGGSKWIGTGGTSPFGHGGYHPEGLRLGGPSNGGGGAIKVWEQRRFRDYDDQQALGTRQIQVALRRLRRFAREGAQQELDLDATIRDTARNAGHLDLKLVAQRRNAVKVLLLMDVGGTMDAHVARVESLFAAARGQFRTLRVHYFHNCPYDTLWTRNDRRHHDRIGTGDLLRTLTPDWRLILVGDATMSPYEILQPGGSTEHHNAEPGATWLQRLTTAFPHAVWLNPEPEGLWPYRQSIGILRQLMHGHMYPLTLPGLDTAMQRLSRR